MKPLKIPPVHVHIRRKTGKSWRHDLGMLILLSVLAFGITEVLQRAGALAGIDVAYTDLWHRIAGTAYVPQHTVLVVIDEESLAKHPDDPLAFWPPLFAKATATLRAAGVTVIGIDFLFSVSPENWFDRLGLQKSEALQKYDLTFRQELNSGKVVVAGAVGHGEPGQPDGVLLPHADYLLSLPNMDMVAGVGLADLVSDEDGVVRRYRMVPPLNLPKEMAQGAPRLTLGALVAVRAAGQDPAASRWTIAGRDYDAASLAPIAFAGPPGALPRLPFHKLLAPDALSDPAVQALRGKAIIIGGDYLGMNDLHPTPYASALADRGGTRNIDMAGPEIQANIVETLLSGRKIATVNDLVRIGLVAALLAAAMLVYQQTAPWVGLLTLAGGCVAGMSLGYAMFREMLLFPAANVQAALLVGFFAVIGLRLTREERDKARIRDMFEGYVSDDVVNMLLESGERVDMGGRTMYLTVLFSDVRNFTTITEKLSAQETIEFLNVYFARVIDVIRAEGGRIDKFIGDAVMAEFGAPYPFPDHAERALRAAVGMRDVADEFRQWMQSRFPDRGLPEFAIGIGVHTGNAVVGNVGSARRMEYTAIGDTVNVASRLEGETKTMGCAIVASATTVTAAGGIAVTGKCDTLKVKGRAEPVEVFEIVDVLPDAGPHATTAGAAAAPEPVAAPGQ